MLQFKLNLYSSADLNSIIYINCNMTSHIKYYNKCKRNTNRLNKPKGKTVFFIVLFFFISKRKTITESEQ